MAEPLLRVEGLSRNFTPARGLGSWLRGRTVPPLVAVDDVSFEIAKGEVFSLVGESGSGKTTLGRCLLRLIEPSAGRVLFDGTDLADLGPAAMRAARRDVQMIFQDPFSSLNPRLTVREALAEVLRVHRLRPQARTGEREKQAFPASTCFVAAADKTSRQDPGIIFDENIAGANGATVGGQTANLDRAQRGIEIGCRKKFGKAHQWP